MAVIRTGTAKKLRLKQSPARPSKPNGRRRALKFFGKVLEAIGRPVFWLGLATGFFLLGIFSTIGRLIISLPRVGRALLPALAQLLLRLLQIIVVLFWLAARLLNLVHQFLAARIRFLDRHLRLFWQQKRPTFKFPRVKRPTIKLPVIKLPSLKLPQIKPPRWRLKINWWATTGLLTLSLLLIGFVYWFIFKDLPHPSHLITRDQIATTKIYDRHGQLLYKIYRQQNRTPVTLTEVPSILIQATIAIEDAEFYQHRGFSPKAIIRSFFQNLEGGKLYGGSTITQQLVKNALLTPERTLRRKIREVILALGTEMTFSKDEILQMYFNEVGYGGATYGAAEAAETYFGKPLADLSLAEAALLAGLPASPTTYSPFGAEPEKAKDRQRTVLNRMVQEGFITWETAEEAKKEEIHFAPQRTDIQAPHFVMYVKDWLVQKYGLRLVEEGGLEVTTTLDLNLQNQVQQTVTQGINQLWRQRVSNGAALVTTPATGEVLAMVGSKDYFDAANDGNVNVTLRPRQPGSSIKPVNYSLALENGFTAATSISDTPITYHVAGQPPYSPRNYDNRFHGNVSLRTALASSYNVPAVKVLAAMGVEKMIQRGQAMGITTWEDPSRFGLSLTLGGGEVKMTDMAVVFGTLANLGTRVDLNPILEVKNYQGKVLETAQGEKTARKVLSANIAYILTDILSDNRARTPGFGSRSVLNVPGHPRVAVKTGTTQNNRDNWTIGYTPDYLVAVWAGNNDNTPMFTSGVTGAAPIWQRIMTHLLKDLPDKEFPQPDNLRRVEICTLTNTLACTGCGGQFEYFLPGTEPQKRCRPETIRAIREAKEKEKEAKEKEAENES